MRRNRGQVMYMPKDGKVNEMPNPKTAEQIFAEKDAKIATLEADLAAQKEKYRWRRQSEEPAPEGEAEALIKAGGELVIAHAIVLNGDTAFEKVTGRRIYLEYWRPLDLPEVRETK